MQSILVRFACVAILLILFAATFPFPPVPSPSGEFVCSVKNLGLDEKTWYNHFTIAVKYRVKFQISTNCKKRLANFQFHEIENMSISNQRNQLQIEIEFHILQPIF